MTGAVDLSGLKQRAQQPAGASGGAAPAGALEVTDSATEEVIASVPNGTAADVERAFEDALRDG